MTDRRPTVAPVAGMDARTRDGQRVTGVRYDPDGSHYLFSGFVDGVRHFWTESGQFYVHAFGLPLLDIVSILEPEAAETPEVGAVTVKPLEWVETAYGGMSCAETIVDTYCVWTHSEADGGRWFWRLTGGAGYGHARTEAEAKAAAQADYEARILSALQPSPSVIPQLVESLRWFVDRERPITAKFALHGPKDTADEMARAFDRALAALRAAEAGERQEAVAFMKPAHPDAADPLFVLAKDRTHGWQRSVFTIPLYTHTSPAINDEMVEAAARAIAGVVFDETHEGDAEAEWPRVAHVARAALSAALEAKQ
jgi:hypothetical protein